MATNNSINAPTNQFLQIANNLSDLNSASTARTNLNIPFNSVIGTSAVNVTLTNPLPASIAYNFTASGKRLILPPANQSNSYLKGAIFTITIDAPGNNVDVYYQDNATGVFTAVAGKTYFCYFSDVSTANGTLQSFPLGSLGGDLRNNASITGGTINNTSVGASTASSLRGTGLIITNATSGYVETNITYYEEYSFSFNWTGAFTLNSQTVSVTRLNNVVFLKLNETLQTATSAAALNSSANLPSRFIPANNSYQMIAVQDNGTNKAGSIRIGGNTGANPGQLNILTSAATGNFAGAGASGFFQTSATYYV